MDNKTINLTMSLLRKISLVDQIKGTVLTPSDGGYFEKIKRWAENAERNAAYIVLVASAEDISRTVSPYKWRN
jgi:hypothetical protein